MHLQGAVRDGVPVVAICSQSMRKPLSYSLLPMRKLLLATVPHVESVITCCSPCRNCYLPVVPHAETSPRCACPSNTNSFACRHALF